MAYLDEQTTRINEMYNNLKKQKLGELTSQRDQGVTDLRRTLSEQLPQYQTARAQADVGQVQNTNRLKEYMANSGAFNSGDNLTRASNILTQRSNAVNQINGNENAFALGINNKIADTENQFNANVNSVNSSLDAQKLQDYMNLQAQARQEQLQREQQAAQIRASQAAAARAAANAQANAKAKESAAQQKALQDQYNKYYDTGFQLKGKGYKNDEGNYVDRYDNDYLYNWVSNIDLPSDYKAKLANDLGVKKPEAKPKVGSNLYNFSPFKYGM